MSIVKLVHKEPGLQDHLPNLSKKIEDYYQILIPQLQEIAQDIQDKNAYLKDFRIAYSGYLGCRVENTNQDQNSDIIHVSNLKIHFYFGDLIQSFHVDHTLYDQLYLPSSHSHKTEPDKLENVIFTMMCIQNIIFLDNIRNPVYWLFPPYIFKINQNEMPEHKFFNIPKIYIPNGNSRFIKPIGSLQKILIKIAQDLKENEYRALAYDQDNLQLSYHDILDIELTFQKLYEKILDQTEIETLRSLSVDAFKESITHLTKSEYAIIYIHKMKNCTSISEFAVHKFFSEKIKPAIFHRQLLGLVDI